MTEPRATRIDIPDHPNIAAELWMGGADSAIGNMLQPEDFAGAWVVDCAGDLPEEYRRAAALWLPRIFTDVEEVPARYLRLSALARSLARCLCGERARDESWDHPAEPPARLYVLCTQGLNRSGLVAGRILRELGLGGDEALALLMRHRPGAVNNLTFARLVRED